MWLSHADSTRHLQQALSQRASQAAVAPLSGGIRGHVDGSAGCGVVLYGRLSGVWSRVPAWASTASAPAPPPPHSEPQRVILLGPHGRPHTMVNFDDFRPDMFQS